LLNQSFILLVLVLFSIGLKLYKICHNSVFIVYFNVGSHSIFWTVLFYFDIDIGLGIDGWGWAVNNCFMHFL